jgi:hypothetical protein
MALGWRALAQASKPFSGPTKEHGKMGIEHWNALAAEQPIEGRLLTCKKGNWGIDGENAPTGPDGVRLVVLMDTAVLGEVQFNDEGELVDQRLGRLDDGFRPASVLEGWAPHTSVVCVGAEAPFTGQVMTFRASSWGARGAFAALIGGYVRLRCQQYPKVYLSVTTKRRSTYTVVDPMFCVAGWVPRKGFAGNDAPALEKQEGLEAKVTIGSAAKAAIDDEIPF